MKHSVAGILLLGLAACGGGSSGDGGEVTRQELTRACLNTTLPGPDPTPEKCGCFVDYLDQLKVDDLGRQDVVNHWNNQQGKFMGLTVFPGTIRNERYYDQYNTDRCAKL